MKRDFKIRGFLGEEAESATAEAKRLYADHLSLAFDLNEYLHEVMGRFEVSTNFAPHLVSAALFTRAVSSYAGVILLAARFMRSEANVLLRTLVEIMFLQGAVREDQRKATDIMKAEGLHVRRTLGAWRKLIKDGHIPSGEESEKYLREAEELAAKLEEQRFKLVEFAVAGGNARWYGPAYGRLSWSVHAQWTELKRHVHASSTGKVEGIVYGLDASETGWQLMLAITAVSLITRDCAIVLGIPLDERWNSLSARAELIYDRELRELPADDESSGSMGEK